MKKEKVLEIEFQSVWDKWAWRITKQNEEVLKRDNFIDEKIDLIKAKIYQVFKKIGMLFLKQKY